MGAICKVVDVLGLRGVDEGIVMPKDKDGNPIGMTRQSFAKDADINTIMARYPNGGVPLDFMNLGTPIFGDFSDLTDFGTVVNRVNQARENFMLLPSALRARFDNDVEKLLNFISTPENVREAVDLKLLPESMLEATYAVRPDLRPPEGASGTDAGQAATGSASAGATGATA